MCPDFGIAKAAASAVRDTDNVDIFLKEFREFEKNGTLPRFIVMSLGEDHTTGTTARHVHAAGLRRQQRPGAGPARRGGHRTASTGPRRRSSSSRTTPRTAPTTSTPTAPSAWSSAPTPSGKHLDSTQYSTVSMIRTMELILGLPPLSQFDAAATADVRLVHRQGRPDALRPRAGPDRPERREHRRWPTAPSGRARWTSASTTGSTTSS